MERQIFDVKIVRGQNRSGIALFFVFSCMLLVNIDCREKDNTVSSPVYTKIAPDYSLVKLAATSDTLRFALSDDTYNTCNAVNVFSQDGREFISFYDKRSESINVYNLKDQTFFRKILVKRLLKKQRLHKTTVYMLNFDSIFATNNTSMYFLDSSGSIKASVDFLEEPRFAWADFENTKPAILIDKRIFVGLRPYVDGLSFKALKDWKVFYEFNMQNEKAVLHYNLPDLYQKNLYGYYFMGFSYCYNNHGKFVLSFPADPNIYETNLKDYHVAYFAKSQFQKEPILPMKKSDFDKKDDKLKNYLLRDSYGPVYFDPYTKRYLRIINNKITENDFLAKKYSKKQRVIIFDEHFKIIGECELDDAINPYTIFFSHSGEMYARTKITDEYALHFVRLNYSDIKMPMSTQFAKNENIPYK